MIQTAGDALLADVLEEPQDDGLRLIYADWLEENGQPERAGFIRWGIQHPGFWFRPYTVLSGYEHDQWRCYRNLLERMRSVWLPIDDYRLFHGSRWNRGFAARIHWSRRQWLLHGPIVVRHHPIERVDVSDAVPCTDGDRYFWQIAVPDKSYSFLLDPLLFVRLPNGLPNGTLGRRYYPTMQEAYTALSEACLAYAKERRP